MAKKDKYEDISSNSRPKGFKEACSRSLERIKIFFMRNRQRNLKALLSVIICLVLVVVAMGGTYIRKMLSLINYDKGDTGNPDATFAEEETEYDEDLSFAEISDVGASSIKEWTFNWATNGGEKMYGKNVKNVLLIGEDDTEGAKHSDSMIVASVNTKEKKITLVSLMRDSYTYMNINGDIRYDKINTAYAWGGASTLMKTISDDLKIEIDHYISIGFGSFKKVIDKMGGISVPITEKEARYMNRTTKVKGFTAGDSVLLNGEQALIYARIRKLDSDIERTRRQRNVIAAAVRGVKASSIPEINEMIETFLPYVTTDYKSSEILSLGTQALRENWMNFDIVGLVEPNENNGVAVNNFRTYSAGGLFVWILDYAKVAREVQLALYGNSNVQITDSHVSPLDMVNGYSSIPATSSVYYNTTSSYDTTSAEEPSTEGGHSWFTTRDRSSSQYSRPTFPGIFNTTTTTLPDENVSDVTEPSVPNTEPTTDYVESTTQAYQDESVSQTLY
ncbi:MAG: LCP family protein [Clostridia bacterium]|nr:LCP family protein [Clostridia bacterium]